jgi:hypothetical protein
VRVMTKRKKVDSLGVAMTAGVLSGITASVLTCPLDVVKTRMQLQAGSSAATHRLASRSVSASERLLVV